MLLLDMWTICSLSAQQMNGRNYNATLFVVHSLGLVYCCHTIELKTLVMPFIMAMNNINAELMLTIMSTTTCQNKQTKKQAYIS